MHDENPSVNQPVSIFRVRAHNTAPDSENKIHDDRVAVKYGFREGLVPGVTVYGYMVPAILERLGRGWLERGAVAFRLHLPCYQGETVVTRCDGSVVTAESENGSLYASGMVSMNEKSDGEPEVFPPYPLPEEDRRPVASAQTIVPGLPLGSVRQKLEAAEESAIPERLLSLANEILVRNFRMSPWIHAGSEVRHQRLAKRGQEIEVSGVIQECFERKGRKFAVAALGISAHDDDDAGQLRTVATVRHTFIYEL
jgi:hypothetical protein